jgi:hypothetical protein
MQTRLEKPEAAVSGKAYSERLAEIEARANAATNGPWYADVTRYHRRPASEQEVVVATDTMSIVRLSGSKGFHEEAMPDAEFIAHARQDVPWLLARVRELEAAATSPKGVTP